MAAHYRTLSLLLLIQISLAVPHHNPRKEEEHEAWQVQLGGDAGGASLPSVPGILAINTWPWTGATAGAFAQLVAGRSAVDAVEAGCTVCERAQCDGTVGFGGSPDSEGEVTQDALMMDGRSFDVGAVGGLRRVKNAIGVARAVMEHTAHSLLVGDKASRFAAMAGFPLEDLNTSRSDGMHARWTAGHCQPNFFRGFPDEQSSCPPYLLPPTIDPSHPPATRESSDAGTERAAAAGGGGMLDAPSEDGIISGVGAGVEAPPPPPPTSFWVAGRVGDAAIAGAGAYADNSGGAAAATGDGDIMMRFLPSFQAVSLMREGVPPARACEKAMRPIIKAFPTFIGAMICVSKDGRIGAAGYGWTFSYSFQNASMPSPIVVVVPPMNR
ncbi:asparaginase-domain-containing protein [Baffinella frigidus]|nr:asparaginase-domain-containing protein [Cryptophyta sp. CCMP2293]